MYACQGNSNGAEQWCSAKGGGCISEMSCNTGFTELSTLCAANAANGFEHISTLEHVLGIGSVEWLLPFIACTPDMRMYMSSMN